MIIQLFLKTHTQCVTHTHNVYFFLQKISQLNSVQKKNKIVHLYQNNLQTATTTSPRLPIN